MVATPFYSPTNNVLGNLFILSNTCYFTLKKIKSHPSVSEVSHLATICISQMTDDGEHFSCTWWPLVYILWRNIYSSLLSIF